jgi:hypothetical protein
MLCNELYTPIILASDEWNYEIFYEVNKLKYSG